MADFQPEFPALILRRLPWHLDRLSFRAVCRDWRHLPPALPLLSFDNTKFQSLDADEHPRRRFTALPDLPPPRTAAAGCYDDWLLYRDDPDARRRPTCLLFNPLSGTTVAGIPLRRDDFPGLMRFPMAKVIVCSPDLVAAMLCRGEIAFYRQVAPSWSVSRSDARGWEWNTDIALYRWKIYAVTKDGDLSVHDFGGGDHGGDDDGVPRTSSHVKHVKMAHPPGTTNLKDLNRWMRYLVVSSGKLLMVTWSVPSREGRSDTEVVEGIKLRVFEADLEMGVWLDVDDLNGQALFIGRGCSKALRLEGDDQRFQGDRVYFLGIDFRGCCSSLTYRETPTYGFYDLRNGTLGQIFLSGRWNVWPQHRMEWFFPCE